MLCEKCHQEEATVHVTEVVAEAPEEMKKHDFCEACFSQTELAKKVNSKAAGWASYGEGATAEIFTPDDEPSS
jgi:protein-arginine kinase activator protein McsA